jgi:hypothetical protein
LASFCLFCLSQLSCFFFASCLDIPHLMAIRLPSSPGASLANVSKVPSKSLRIAAWKSVLAFLSEMSCRTGVSSDL